jgi:hypothetical protein
MILSVAGFCLIAIAAAGAPGAERRQGYVKHQTWPATMLAAREMVGAAPDKKKAAQDVLSQAMTDFPVECDWFLQENGGRGEDWLSVRGDSTGIEQRMLGRVLEELGPEGQAMRGRLDQLVRSKVAGSDPRWLKLYTEACRKRRQLRLKPLLAKWPKIVFAKHYPMGGSHYAYTEGQSDAQGERHFVPGTALCVIDLSSGEAAVHTLIDDPQGVIRDVDVSHDGRKILFAWKKSDREDDYHLYDMDVATGNVRQLTFGLGYADYEPCYLPSGDIVFNSTRCVQTVDCFWTEVGNLYTCDKDGKYLRRLSFDQVHTNYPTVLDDGRVVYTRWDYNDRGQMYVQALFQMNPDGTGQTEFYGNNSWFPTTLIHARGIPGTQKVLAIFTGHHAKQAGKLGIVDPATGRQENQGTQLIAPVRKTPAAKEVDSYGQQGELFQYPYPLSETHFLVSYAQFGGNLPLFGIYFMDIHGRRELLASDPKIACGRMVPLAPRPVPHVRPSVVDYRKATGAFYMQDVYAGPGLAGVPRGTIKKLRVVALQFRVAGIGLGINYGPAGWSGVSTPVSSAAEPIGGGSWDVKVVLGNAKVYDDGSAYFEVPARTPVYFQALNEKGHAVQTMRSWATLQPGETSACVGCHEHKNASVPGYRQVTGAMRAGLQQLEPFYGPPRGFSFPREIQPILDKHCTSCHSERGKSMPSGYYVAMRTDKSKVLIDKQSEWHYTGGAKAPGAWQDPTLNAAAWPTGKGGFGSGGAMVQTKCNMRRIVLRKTFEIAEVAKPVCPVLNVAHQGNVEVFINGVRAAAAAGASEGYQFLPVSPEAAKAITPGTNQLAVLCHNPQHNLFIDAGLLDAGAPLDQLKPGSDPVKAFSLLGDETKADRDQRRWSESYAALTRRGRPSLFVNWLSPQSAPPMLPPYHAGATRSKLMTMLEEGHGKVKLSAEEMEKIACWIDLLVPYCGDYVEGHDWSDQDVAKYNRYMAKRIEMEQLDRGNIEELVGAPPPATPLPTPAMASLRKNE